MTIQGAIFHARLRSIKSGAVVESDLGSMEGIDRSALHPEASVGAHGLVLHVRVDTASWDELLLGLCLVIAGLVAALCSHSERLVINHAVGVVVLERSTLLTTMRATCEAAFMRWRPIGGVIVSGFGDDLVERPSSSVSSNSSHVMLLAPATLVEEVEIITRVTRERQGALRTYRTVTLYGLQLRLRNHRLVPLGLGHVSSIPSLTLSLSTLTEIIALSKSSQSCQF